MKYDIDTVISMIRDAFDREDLPAIESLVISYGQHQAQRGYDLALSVEFGAVREEA